MERPVPSLRAFCNVLTALSIRACPAAAERYGAMTVMYSATPPASMRPNNRSVHLTYRLDEAGISLCRPTPRKMTEPVMMPKTARQARPSGSSTVPGCRPLKIR